MSICYQLIFLHTQKASVKIVCPFLGSRLRKKCHCFSSAWYKVQRPSISSSNLRFEVGIFDLPAGSLCSRNLHFYSHENPNKLLNKKVMVALVCFAQTKAKALCLWLFPSNQDRAAIKCLGALKPRHPRVTMPHAARSYPCGCPAGQQEILWSFVNSLSPASHPFLQRL